MIKFHDWAKEKGYKIAWGGIEVLDDVKSEINRRGCNNEFHPNQKKYLENLSYYNTNFNAKTVVVIAANRGPACHVTFNLEDGPLTIMIPPGYKSHRETDINVLKEVEMFLSQEGIRVTTLNAPLKNISVRLGMASYGRNNITYIDGLGSYFRLFGFVIDAELETKKWTDGNSVEVLSTCQNCKICQKACPTGAIGEDRFLLHVERCITLYNESSSLNWPDWLPITAHNCLIGCMLCQIACPHNNDLLKYSKDKYSFSYEETMLILNSTEEQVGPVWEEIRNKYDMMGLLKYEHCMSRNLKGLIDKHSLN